MIDLQRERVHVRDRRAGDVQRSRRIGRIELDQVLADRIHLESGRGNARARLRDLLVGRHVDVIRRRHREPLTLVIAEEEHLVLPDRSAERPAVLLVLDRCGIGILAQLLRGADVEEIRTVGPIVVTEVVARSVRRVAAALHDDIDRRPAFDAELG